MEQVNHFPLTPRTDAEYESVFNHLIAETKRTREKMEEDQKEIQRLRAETRAILTQLKSS